MVEIKVGKPTLQVSDAFLAMSRLDFRQQVCKLMAIPLYCVAAKTPAELIPLLALTLIHHMNMDDYNTCNIY
ncbi:hypothetical protein GCM10027578_26950 [Spirosoma luteolum]